MGIHTHRSHMQADNVTAGALEASMDILLRFQHEILTEQQADEADEHRRAVECNTTRYSSLHTIAKAHKATGELMDATAYNQVVRSLKSAIDNVRSHYSNATQWVKRASAVYVHTTQELERASRELQDMELRHSSVVNTLQDLVARVVQHKKTIATFADLQPPAKPTDRNPKGPVVTGHSNALIVGLIQTTANLIKTNKLDEREHRLQQLVTALLETTTANTNIYNGWHEQVTRLSHSITAAVDESKNVRTKPLVLEVKHWQTQLRLDGIEMKRALDAQSKTSEALLTAKHSQRIIETRSKESEVKRLQFNRATKKARGILDRMNVVCDKEHSEFKEINDANSESLGTINEFLGMLTDEKTEQESKLEEAVEMMEK